MTDLLAPTALAMIVGAAWAVTTSLWHVVAKRDLLYMLTWREIRIKYKQSVMGMLWAVLMPAVIVSAGIVVRVGSR